MDRLPTPVFMGFPGGSDGKELACNAGDMGLIPGTATHSSTLAWRIPMDSGAWRASPWGCKELDMTEQLSTAHTFVQIHRMYNTKSEP